MKTINSIFLMLTLAACGSISSQPNPDLKPLGLLEVTFSNLGANLAVSARNVQSRAINDVADGIQIKLLSRGSFDVGTRGVDGVRYLSATFAVRNANASGTAYPISRSNLSFLAVATLTTLAQTAVARLRKFDGTAANPNLAQDISPTHGMEFRADKPNAAFGLEDFQAFTEAQISPLAASLSSSGVSTVFPYGFVTRCASNCTPRSRLLPANPIATQFDGRVTFAVKLPLQANPSDDPFSFSLLFEVVDDTQTKVTKSGDEVVSSPARTRASSLNSSSLVSGQDICTLRTAGLDASVPQKTILGTGLEAAGSLDTCWNGTGTALTAVKSVDFGKSAMPLPDGKVIAVGSASSVSSLDIALVRYNPDGSLDSSFGNAGKVLSALGIAAKAASLQTDGKIVVIGQSGADFALVRYNANGSLDSNFGNAGITITDFNSRLDTANALSLQPDGKIIAVGSSQVDPSSDPDFAAARYNPDGSLDSGFGNAGKLLTDINAQFDLANAVTIQNDGKILLAGSTKTRISSFGQMVLARYNPNGTLDSSFGGGGIVLPSLSTPNSESNAVAVQPDGKIVVFGNAGGGNQDFALVRVNSDGVMDSGFGIAGVVLTNLRAGSPIPSFDRGKAVTILADGKILCAGDGFGIEDQYALTRHNPDGSLDTSFGLGGKVVILLGTDTGRPSINSLSLQPDGRVLLAGSQLVGSLSEIAVLRYWQ
jgi:uncharacterized delta-60 repeat protein